MNNCFYFIIIIILLIYIFYLQFKPKCNPIAKKEIQNIIRSSSRYSNAANQDLNPFIAMLHANYGAAYLWALQEIKSNDEIQAATGINMIKYRQAIIDTQDKATLQMIKNCPKFKISNPYLAKIALEYI